MNKKILPVAYPPITTAPAYADALAILMSCNEALGWVYSHYIQTYIVEVLDGKAENFKSIMPCFFGDFDNRRIVNTVSDCIFLNREINPFLNIFEIPNVMINTLGESFVSFIKKTIDLDMYVYGFCNASNIKEYNRSEAFSHEVFIYGYNDEDKTFYYADFPNNEARKYTFAVCSYDEIEEAFHSVKKLFIPVVKSIAAIQLYKDGPFAFELSYIKESVSEYLHPSKDSVRRLSDYVESFVNIGDFSWKTKVYVGTDAFNYLANIDDRVSKGRIDVRLYNAMYEHKVMMSKRISYLIERDCLSSSKYDLSIEYKSIEEEMLSVRNKILKYNITKNDSTIKSIPAQLYAIREKEEIILKSIFDI
jgi:hypothetical protein